MTALALGVLVTGAVVAAQAPAQAQAPAPSDAEIRRILVERIDVQHQSVGIVGGVIEQVFPEGEKDYFLKLVDAQITFETGAGTATAVVLHQNGRDLRAVRMP